jgi:hypothetical protein
MDSGMTEQLEAPATGRRRANRAAPSEENGHKPAERGWNAVKDKTATLRNLSASRLTVKDDEVLVHFLEPDPFAVIFQHWVSQRPYTCLEENCPLCAAGVPTRFVAMFNTFDMKTGKVLHWSAGPNAVQAVQDQADSERYSPINRADLYFAIKRTKKSNGFYEFSLTPVKARDLDEDWGCPALTDEEIEKAAAEMHGDDAVPHTSRSELQEIADKLED